MEKFMKITVLFGSPHKRGHTAALCEGVLRSIPDAQVGFINAYEESVSPCVGCGGCRDTAQCVKFRDMDSIIAALQEAELIVIAFPVYFAGVPSPLKAIIDRLQPLYCTTYAKRIRPQITKRAIVLTTSGGSVDKSIIGGKTLQYVANLFGANLLGIVSAQNTDGSDADLKIQNAVNDALKLINA
jgi:multimeric flavodoxin WrbA